MLLTKKSLGWKNSRHFATSPMVCPRNDVCEKKAEIPYWWRVTTQTWVVALIGWKFDSPNQKQYPDPGSDRSLVWNFCASFSDIISRGNHRLVPSCYLCVFGGERRLGLYKGASLPMSPRAPQLNPNLLSPQKHINSDWVRVWRNQPPVASQNVGCLIRLLRGLNTEKLPTSTLIFPWKWLLQWQIQIFKLGAAHPKPRIRGEARPQK